MNDSSIKTCFGIAAIVAVYITYSLTHREANGVLFGSIAALLAGLAGYTVGLKRGK